MPRLAGHQPEVDRALVIEVSPFSHLDRVDLTDQVGDRGVRRRQFLGIALRAVQPLDRRVVATLGHRGDRTRAHRGGGVVRQFRPGHNREPLVQQAHQGSDDPRLGLATLTQQAVLCRWRWAYIASQAPTP